MPPYLALFLCVLFILIVYKIDFKQKSEVSFAIWVPLIWYASVVSRPVSLWFDSGNHELTKEDYLSGNPINVILYTTLIVIGILILLKRKVDWQQIIKSNSWIFLLFLYMGISILWSDFAIVSLKRWIRVIGVLVMVLVVLTDSKPFEAILKLLKTCFLVNLTLSIIFIKYFRSIGVAFDPFLGTEMWIGTTQGKNILGQLAWTSGIFFFWNIMRTWGSKKIYINLLLLIMALWLLKGSDDAYSATSIFVLLFGVFILFLLHFKRLKPDNLHRYLNKSIFLIVIVFLVFQFTAESIFDKSLISTTIESLGRNTTLTDRTELWSDILEIASHHRILGVGYGSFWIGDVANNLWEKYKFHPGQAHNGYLDVYVELGLIGVFLLISIIFFTYKNILKTFTVNFEYGKLRMVFLFTILVNNITESSLLKPYNNLWFLFLLFAVNTPDISQPHDPKQYNARS